MGNSNRGFASMVSKDPDRQKKIARLGGRRAHQLGTAHEFTPEEAKIAGRKGGQISGRLRSDEYFHQISGSQNTPLSKDVSLQNVVEIDPVSEIKASNIDIILVDIKEGK